MRAPARARALTRAAGRTRAAGLAICCAIVGLAAFVAQTGAASGRPEPGCAGVSITDPKGDLAGRIPTGGEPQDIRSVFFTMDKGVVTANVQVTSFSKTVPTGFTGAEWFVEFDVGDARRWVGYTVQASGNEFFTFGSVNKSGEAVGYLAEGITSGKVFTGKDGIVAIVVPPSLAKRGAKLEHPVAVSLASAGDPLPASYLETFDTAPDSDAGKAFITQPCEAPSADKPVAAPSSSTTKPPTLEVLTRRIRPGARKIAIEVRSSGTITNVVARLESGRSVIGKGKLAKLERTGVIKLNARRGLKRGSYRLRLSGRAEDGQVVAGSAVLRAR